VGKKTTSDPAYLAFYIPRTKPEILRIWLWGSWGNIDNLMKKYAFCVNIVSCNQNNNRIY
jgi:hypothetical protein